MRLLFVSGRDGELPPFCCMIGGGGGADGGGGGGEGILDPVTDITTKYVGRYL